MLDKAPKKRGDARERILQLAEAAILEKGFAATSIDELIAAAEITKSGFFYHFRDKTELARVLLVRYIERARPRLFIHGHQHIDRETKLADTRVIGVYGQRRLGIVNRSR